FQFAGVSTFALHEPGRDDVIRVQHGSDRFNHLRAGRGDDHNVMAGLAVVLDQVDGLVIDKRIDDRVQRFGYRTPYHIYIPDGHQLGQVVAHLCELVVVRAADGEHELCVSTTQYGAAVEQTAFEKRLTERQGAGLGDDRFVQVEKCGAPGHAARIRVVGHGQS